MASCSIGDSKMFLGSESRLILRVLFSLDYFTWKNKTPFVDHAKSSWLKAVPFCAGWSLLRHEYSLSQSANM
jgi:hypothetical protein